MNSKKVHIYLQDWLPRQDGTGPNSRIYSNVRAYLDSGFETEIVYVQTKADAPLKPEPSLAGVKWTHVPALGVNRESLARGLHRLAYWAGWPDRLAMDYRFRTRALIRAEVKKRVSENPASIHHFEYLGTASAIADFPAFNSLWSLQDIESDFTAGHQRIRQDVEGKTPKRSEVRAAKRLSKTEKLVALNTRLVLCIAKHEREVLRQEWGCSHAEFFPMSMPIENPVPRSRAWLADGKLKLLHVGRIDSLPSFYSLQFLLSEVFPRLDQKELAQLELIVVGELRESRRALLIQELASRFPQVRFTGFQDNLRDFYSTADLQVVGSTTATGLRTRIVESFAYGMPVLSTRIGAAGVEGLVDGKNILLAEGGTDFAQHLRTLLGAPQRLQSLAISGGETYEKIYSRKAVALALQSLLSRYLSI